MLKFSSIGCVLPPIFEVVLPFLDSSRKLFCLGRKVRDIFFNIVQTLGNERDDQVRGVLIRRK
jgi:hypothetical protein